VTWIVTAEEVRVALELATLDCERRTANGELRTPRMRLAIEELIQKWLAENPNERLPGAGEPLNLDEYFRWPENLRLAYSLLKNSGHVPEEVELLREIGQLKHRLAESTDELSKTELRRRIQEQEVALNIKLERHRRR
jgi:hypothetical protein